QVTQSLQSKFGLKITFRQLLDQVSSLEALTAYVDAKLPPEALPAQPPRVSVAMAPAASPSLEFTNGAGHEQPSAPSSSIPDPGLLASFSGAASSGVEAIVREQLQLMARQIDLLRGTCWTPRASAVEQTLPVSSAPPIPPEAAKAPAAVEAAKDRVGEEAAGSTQNSKSFGPFKPIQKGAVGELTEEQARHLENLIKRYTARTPRSKEYTQNHRPVLADPRAASGFRSQWKAMVYPTVSARSRGSRFWDLDGNEYIDILNGYGPIMFGHAPEFVTRAVAAQMEKGFEIGPQSPLAGEVAGLICELTGMDRVTFCNTGSEAVMAAIRVARTVTGRSRFVFFSGDYHGTFDEVLVKGIRKGGSPHAVPVAPGIPLQNVGLVTVLDYGTNESLEYIRAHA
ncbi:MAG: aminotransferase class III-fold pyridoxal phosphate-dependent enzyme, partial [Isosphaeraceae bacterium]